MRVSCFWRIFRPEWVVEIEHHAKGGHQNIQGQKTVLGGRFRGEFFWRRPSGPLGARNMSRGFEVGA